MNFASQPSHPKSSSQAMKKHTSDVQKKFKCLFYQRNPSDHQNHACKNTGYDDISSLRYHLTRVHTQGLGCECHPKNTSCPRMGEKLKSFDLRASPYAKLTPDEKWITLFQELFPNDPIPSPYEEQALTYEQERKLIVLLAQRFGKESVAKIYGECKKQALKQAPSSEPKATQKPYLSATSYTAHQHTPYVQQPRPSSSQRTQTLPQSSQINQQSRLNQQSQINQQPRFNQQPQTNQQPEINQQPQINQQSHTNQQPQINQQPQVNPNSSPYSISFAQYQPTMYSTRSTANHPPQEAPSQYSYRYNTRPSATPNSYPATYNAHSTTTPNPYPSNYNYPPYSTG